jgi:hypothetical protein
LSLDFILLVCEKSLYDKIGKDLLEGLFDTICPPASRFLMQFSPHPSGTVGHRVIEEDEYLLRDRKQPIE